jgi:hypothetical protein
MFSGRFTLVKMSRGRFVGGCNVKALTYLSNYKIYSGRIKYGARKKYGA